MELLILCSIALVIFGLLICAYVLIKKHEQKMKLHDKGNPMFPKIKRYVDESKSVPYLVYIFFHGTVIGLFLLFSLVSISNLNFKVVSRYFFITLLILGIVNLLVYLRVMLFRKTILKDLFRVHEILFWQSKIKMPEDKSLAYASDLIDGPLKQKMIELSGCYRLKRDVIAKLAEIRYMSPVEELHAFTYMLEEKYKTGMTEDYHRTSMEILKRLRRVDKKLRKITSLQMLFVSAVVLFGLFFIVTGGPIIIESYKQFTLIFK